MTGVLSTATPAEPPPIPVVGMEEDEPLISLPWENMEVSLSLVNTVSNQTYQVYPQLDDRLPSRKSLRTMKKLLQLKQQQQQQRKHTSVNGPKAPALNGNPNPMKAHSSPPKALPPVEVGPPSQTGVEADGSVKSCHICGKSFSKTTYLKRHIQSHSTVKPYKCDICGWGFFQLCNLKRHTASHNTGTGEGFKCVHCPATFSTKSVLSVHMRDAHSSKRDMAIPPSNAPIFGSQITITPNKRSSVSEEENIPAVIPAAAEEVLEEEEIAPPVLPTSPVAQNSGNAAQVMTSELPKGSGGGPCYTCTICQATFEKVSVLNKHFKVHAGN
eukprot:maker-scaffold1604_size34042-snap-gene-0.10 protein:Tk08078 transcript:maker-scaffold1604_size34042-snap-gene-0.10-mRNA-1 annotation:"oocyte zinc finger protein 6-like"